MTEIHPNRYNCRLCLKRTITGPRINIFGGDFPKMLNILTSIKVSENDGLPKYSCTKCALEVKTALIVKKRIIKAHKALVKSLKIKKANRIKLLPEFETITLDDTPPSTALLKSDVCLSESEINYNRAEFTEVDNDYNNEESFCAEFTEVGNGADNHLIEDKVKFEEISIANNDISESEGTNQTSEASPHNTTRDDDEIKKIDMFKCETCDESFPNKYSYSLHSLKHKKTKCEFCKRLIRSDNYKRHLILHTGDPVDCKFCGITCKNLEILRFHTFYNHKHSADSYICEECGRNFRIKSAFLLHKRKVHLRLRNFKCKLCGKAFFTNADMNKHINTHHKKLRPYVCEFCGTGYSSAYALKTHKRQHTNEKPYKCQYCDEGFRQKVSMRSHMKSKHGIQESQDHQCDSCDRGFATNLALEIHQRLHAQKKCEVCSEVFVDEVLLEKHLEEHNVTEDEENDIKQESTKEY